MSATVSGDPPTVDGLPGLRAALEAVRAELALDPRSTVFDLELVQDAEGLVLAGQTTDPDALDRLVRRLAAAGGTVLIDRVVRLPDAEASRLRAAVRAAVAPVHGEPRISSAQVSQYLIGDRVELLGRRDDWWRVRGHDGYIGWIHAGYLATGDASWASGWDPDSESDGVVSLGAVLVDDRGEPLARLPWGACVMRAGPDCVRLPDGRIGRAASGEIVPRDQLAQRFPPRGPELVRSAMQWLGTPYQWGGITPAGADCSGFVKAVSRLHGIALPRDSDQQARAGEPVDPGDDFSGCHPGDLLFFAERRERVTHVALSLGGARIIHSALSNGGVMIDDLNGEGELARRLAASFVAARRVVEA